MVGLEVVKVEVCVAVRMVKGWDMFSVVKQRMDLVLVIFQGFWYIHRVLQCCG